MAVAVFRRRKRAEEYGLVVLSMELPYWLYEDHYRFYLCVPEDHAEAVSGQLETYHRESRRWPPLAKVLPPEADSHPWSLVVFAIVLIGCFVAQERQPGLDQIGMMNILAVAREGQLWRLVTALTLHADIGHLASNLLSGVCFGLLVNRAFGYGFGWLCIVLSGMLGNALTLAVHLPDPNYALGASTAIFGALGMLIAHGAIQLMRAQEGFDWRRGIIPIVGGLTILGLTGATGEHVDIAGHICGFAAGVALGIGATLITFKKIPGSRWQIALGTLALALVAGAWLWAGLREA